MEAVYFRELGFDLGAQGVPSHLLDLKSTVNVVILPSPRILEHKLLGGYSQLVECMNSFVHSGGLLCVCKLELVVPYNELLVPTFAYFVPRHQH